MKKTFIFSAVVAAMLVGCNDAKEATKEAAHKAAETTTKAVETTHEAAKATTEAVKESASKTVEAAKETATKAVEATKEAASATVEKAKETVSTAKESAEKKVEEAKAAVEKKVEEAKAAVTPSVDGKALYATCAGCHGQKGEKKALGASQIIGGWDAKKVEDALNGYKAGTYGGAMKGVMAGQVAKLDEAKIKALAEYISTLK